jgi:hypothetical protein
VEAAVHAIENQPDALAEFVGQPLSDHSADNRR